MSSIFAQMVPAWTLRPPLLPTMNLPIPTQPLSYDVGLTDTFQDK